MKLSMIYMASGFGSRFGANKLLTPFLGKCLYLHGLEHLWEAAGLLSGRSQITCQLILVSQYREILENGPAQAAAAGAPPILPVYNPESSQGITASIRLGVKAAWEDADAYLFFVGDQPCMEADTMAAFAEGFLKSGKAMGCVSNGGRLGNPSAFRSSCRSQLLTLEGDRGGKQLMKQHMEDVWLKEVTEKELEDIDLPRELEVLEKNRRV